MALIGFDNWEPMAAGTRPPLTTVDANLHEAGRLAAQQLLARINGGRAETGVRKVRPWLVIRGSTGTG